MVVGLVIVRTLVTSTRKRWATGLVAIRCASVRQTFVRRQERNG